jgi:hypothetical protein
MNGTDNSTFTINAAKGKYDGSPGYRSYDLILHTDTIPADVLLNGKKLARYSPAETGKQKNNGYYIDTSSGKAILHIQTPKLSTRQKQEIMLRND